MRILVTRLGVVLAGMLLVVCIPGISLAKGVGYDHAEVEGPGLAGKLTIPNRYPYLLNGEAFDMAVGRYSMPERPSDGELGPRYLLTYYFQDGPPVEVAFFPYAEPRPIGFIRGGQVISVPTSNGIDDVPVRVGWYDYPPSLVPVLQEQGLPLSEEPPPSYVPWFLAIGTIAVAFLLRKSRTRESIPEPPRKARISAPECLSEALVVRIPRARR